MKLNLVPSEPKTHFSCMLKNVTKLNNVCTEQKRNWHTVRVVKNAFLLLGRNMAFS